MRGKLAEAQTQLLIQLKEAVVGADLLGGKTRPGTKATEADAKEEKVQGVRFGLPKDFDLAMANKSLFHCG